VKNSSWRIEFSCPQCGAPSVLNETDRLFFCAFCRTRSYLTSPGPFQFCLPARAEFADSDIVAVPYWRIRGVLFSRPERGSNCAFSLIDTTEAAVPSPLLPRSLGVLPQALSLRFAFPQAGTRFLAVLETIDLGLNRTLQVLDALESENAEREAGLRCFVGETTSVVYVPLVVRADSLLDAVRGKPLCRSTAPEARRLFDFRERPAWQVSFHPALCPSCGWDLEGESESVVLLCRHCASAWVPASSGFQRCALHCLAGPDSSVYLPFWKFPCQGLDPSVCSNAFWVPAFKVRPDLLIKLAQRMTLWQPKPSLDDSIGPYELYPVTLPAVEAGQLLPFVDETGSGQQPGSSGGPSFPSHSAPEPHLVYVPFDQNPSELFLRPARVSLFRGALRHGRNL